MKHLGIVLLILSPFLLRGQAYLDSLPSGKDVKLIMLGEEHFLPEVDSLEAQIIRHYALQEAPRTIYVFLERSYAFNYYIDKLFNYDDSISLKQYFNARLLVGDEDEYNFIMQLYNIQQQTHNLKIKCIDVCWENASKRQLYALHDLCSQYEFSNPDINKWKDTLAVYAEQKYFMNDSVCQIFVQSFIRHFRSCRQSYKIALSPYDYDYLKNMMKSSYSSFEKREKTMQEYVSRNYHKNHLHILPIGFYHISKHNHHKAVLKGKVLANEKMKSLAQRLHYSGCSPYRGKVYSILLCPLSEKRTRRDHTDSTKFIHRTTTFNKAELPPDVLENLPQSEEEISVIRIDKRRYPIAKKEYDMVITLKSCHSSWVF